MPCYGILGYPLGHSRSKEYFEGRLDYRVFEFDDVAHFLAERPSDLGGFNVTTPHKVAIIEHLDDLSIEAKTVGAVNCVKIDNKKLIGYNTDIYGFEMSLREFLGGDKIKKALIFGNGGASQAAQYTLTKMDIEFNVVSRAGGLTYENLSDELLEESKLLINTTVLGMSPKLEGCVEINYSKLGSFHYLYDMVYNPMVTKFMSLGLKHSCKVKCGLDMLHLQAEKSFEIWTSLTSK